MLGGYQIINLSNIDLTIGTSQVSITDKDVLAQLRELREHIEDNYNFAIPLNRKLKPVLLRLRDKKNGEKQEVSVWANLSIITNNKTFKIEALVDSVSMKAIQIEVVFQQLTDDDGNPYWDIKTAKYLYTEAISIEEINGEENPSVKPIYCHPISIQGTSGDSIYKIKLALLIFDNNSEAYNTHAKLVAKLQEIFAINSSAVFPITGGLYNTSDSRLHIAQKIDKDGDQINIRTLRSDGESGYFALGSFNTPNCEYYDGVNKIN